MKSKLGSILLSVAIALALWFYVVTVISPNSDKNFYNIPINIQGSKVLEERDLMITGADVSTVTLHLEGNRVDLNKLSSSNISIDVDVSKIYEAGTYDLTYTMVYGDLPSSAITVLSKNPGSIKVVVEEKLTKPIPVKVIYSGTVAENYMPDTENVKLSTDTVNISGPKAVIDKITMARVDVNLNNRSESLNDRFAITLCDENGQPVDAQKVTTDVAEINLDLRVVRVKTITLTPNIIYGGGATKENTTVTISPAEIQISGSDAHLEKLAELKFDVDLSSISADGDLTYPITLPEGVANETGVSEVTVHVTFKELVTKAVTVTKFSVINKPEGYDVTLITKALEVQLRGPASDINNLKASDVTVIVDLANITQGGTVKVKATIECADQDVGAIYDPEKPYMVSATIS